ncbi:MAG: DEAD/DEAH box helicase [Verrucomicrobiota bacterium]
MNRLHPALASWMETTHGSLTDAQEACLPSILNRRSVLLSAPTGSGKTLAGFLGILDGLLREEEEGRLSPGVRVLYVSPLRALAYDMQKNLTEPLKGMGLEGRIRVGMRTSDTKASERAQFKRRPPAIFLTTPESLAILLAQKSCLPALQSCRYVIVDELHALAENKRGAHLAVSMERLEGLVGQLEINGGPLCRIGLSATVAPLEEAAGFLMGTGRACEVVEIRRGRRSIVEVMTPLGKDPYPPAGWTATRVIRDLAREVERRQSVLLFTNTRSGAESIALRLKQALPEITGSIEAHHSSLDRDLRLEVEDRLKRGELRAVVCSTSLELGIDIGAVDLVIMISTPKGISRTLQRLGRSGHSIHKTSHGILVATNINDLIECTVCAEMTRRRTLDPLRVPGFAVDVIAQHIVGMAAAGGVTREEALTMIRKAHPFRDLREEAFDRILNYLAGGGRSLEGQYRDTFGKIVERDGRWEIPNANTLRDYLVNVGTIHAEGVVRILLGRRTLGTVEEGFMKRLKPGDCFVLAGQVVRLIEAGVGEARVEKARRALPTVPRWGANKMPLSSGLAREVRRLRGEVDRRMREPGGPQKDDDLSLPDWLVEAWNLSRSNAEAVVRHFEQQARISSIPTEKKLLIECYRECDEETGKGKVRLHYFFHCLIGRSANDALSRILAHRLKQAVGGNALVTIDDYGFLLTVQPYQELDLSGWRALFFPEKAEQHLRQALEGSELVKWQFRGVAQTGLMVPRNLPGKERQLRQVRWSAEILFRVLTEHEPDHPLLEQAYREAMHTFLDLDGATSFLRVAGKLEWVLEEVPVVTPFSFGIYASKIKESMMMESPDEAIERLYLEMQAKLKAAGRENA